MRRTWTLAAFAATIAGLWLALAAPGVAERAHDLYVTKRLLVGLRPGLPATFQVNAETGLLTISKSLSGQTTENNNATLALTTNSTYLTGTNLTYSGARGSSALKITGTYSGVNGGYSNIYSTVTTTGAHTADGAGVIGIKGVLTNTAALADGNIYGGQFIAKHNHATNDMTASAALVGLEAWAYDSNTGTVGTLLGANLGYHNECSTTQVGGSVHRALQVFCDDAAGADAADEATGICIWNMAGTQTYGINMVKSDGGFTTDIKLQNGETISNATDGAVALTGTLTAPALTPVADSSDARVCTSADYGKVIVLTHADTVAVTLPANGAAAGSWIDFMLAGNDSLAVTISAATADSLIGPNDADLKSVTWGSGHRIGAYCRMISDGSYWHVLNLGGTTMTYTD